MKEQGYNSIFSETKSENRPASHPSSEISGASPNRAKPIIVQVSKPMRKLLRTLVASLKNSSTRGLLLSSSFSSAKRPTGL